MTTYGQDAQDLFDNGIDKHNSQDYYGAIKEYTKVIELDNGFVEAYYNRGVCEQVLKNLNSAMSDFNKTIELDSVFIKAYYSRATVYTTQEKYEEALSDLDKVVALDKYFPNALTLRGQIRVQTGYFDGACDDFQKAKLQGDKLADKYISQFCGNEQLSGESFMLDWPDNENWKMANSQENDQIIMIELIHSDETLEKWTEFGSMMSIKGMKNIPMDVAMNLMYEESKKHSPDSKLTFIEKDETAEYPWIIFTIESPYFITDKTPESQLWYIIQGKTALYTNFRAIKKATIPNELKEKWAKFFKTGKIVYK
jgi:tetratricopeptide (TPR) repeat protein